MGVFRRRARGAAAKSCIRSYNVAVRSKIQHLLEDRTVLLSLAFFAFAGLFAASLSSGLFYSICSVVMFLAMIRIILRDGKPS